MVWSHRDKSEYIILHALYFNIEVFFFSFREKVKINFLFIDENTFSAYDEYGDNVKSDLPSQSHFRLVALDFSKKIHSSLRLFSFLQPMNHNPARGLLIKLSSNLSTFYSASKSLIKSAVLFPCV